MKADVHPKNYRTMIFRDSASGQSFLSKSCANTNYIFIYCNWNCKWNVCPRDNSYKYRYL